MKSKKRREYVPDSRRKRKGHKMTGKWGHWVTGLVMTRTITESL